MASVESKQENLIPHSNPYKVQVQSIYKPNASNKTALPPNPNYSWHTRTDEHGWKSPPITKPSSTAVLHCRRLQPRAGRRSNSFICNLPITCWSRLLHQYSTVQYSCICECFWLSAAMISRHDLPRRERKHMRVMPPEKNPEGR